MIRWLFLWGCKVRSRKGQFVYVKYAIGSRWGALGDQGPFRDPGPGPQKVVFYLISNSELLRNLV